MFIAMNRFRIVPGREDEFIEIESKHVITSEEGLKKIMKKEKQLGQLSLRTITHIYSTQEEDQILRIVWEQKNKAKYFAFSNAEALDAMKPQDVDVALIFQKVSEYFYFAPKIGYSKKPITSKIL